MTDRFPCHVVDPRSARREEREVIEERPLRIVLDGKSVATLMRTPGDEAELALGFLVTEGIIGSPADVGALSFCREASSGEGDEVRACLAPGAAAKAQWGSREALSSCSTCGDRWIEAFAEQLVPFEKLDGRLRQTDVLRLRDAMNARQPVFRSTGSAHGAALCEVPIESASSDVSSVSVVVREDLGRHNALDKAVGAALTAGIGLRRSLLLLSSRLSLEMLAKAARAGISDVAGVGAPSASAIRLAERLNMFLAGFVRGDTMTVYCGFAALGDPAGGRE